MFKGLTAPYTYTTNPNQLDQPQGTSTAGTVQQQWQRQQQGWYMFVHSMFAHEGLLQVASR